MGQKCHSFFVVYFMYYLLYLFIRDNTDTFSDSASID